MNGYEKPIWGCRAVLAPGSRLGVAALPCLPRSGAPRRRRKTLGTLHPRWVDFARPLNDRVELPTGTASAKPPAPQPATRGCIRVARNQPGAL
jgi:hypothetical protein